SRNKRDSVLRHGTNPQLGKMEEVPGLQAFSVKSRYKTPDAQSGPFARMWSTPIDLYCERVTPSFWAEPLNALSNIAFLVAAHAAYDLWRRGGKGDPAFLPLIFVVAVVGLGAFAFFTFATRGILRVSLRPLSSFQ